MRPLWSGTIAFGLVSVPVHLFPANRSGGVSLRMIDDDGAPLARHYFCTLEGVPLGPDDIVRGYEVEDGAFVVVGDDELDALAPEKSQEIDLRRFVERDAIDPVLMDRAYFLTPAKGSTKAYRLLAHAMQEEGRAGIATFVMRGKEYLVAIVAGGGILRAETLRFADELRSPEDVGLAPLAEPAEAEADALLAELEGLEGDELEPGTLADRHSRRLMALVEAKLESGDDVVRAPEEGPEESAGEAPVDLMAALKASLDGGDGRGAEGRARPAADGGARAAADGSRPPALRERTKAELYRLAQERAIEGRSAMTKEELVDALEA